MPVYFLPLLGTMVAGIPQSRLQENRIDKPDVGHGQEFLVSGLDEEQITKVRYFWSVLSSKFLSAALFDCSLNVGM